MSEVFSISGAPLGATNNCPTGWTQTPNGNCGGPGPSYRAPAAEVLQNAINALGKLVGDAILAVTVDGVIGPVTVLTVNRALTKHVGSGQAPASLRTGKLTIAQVAQNATQLGSLIAAEVGRRGGVVTAAKPATPSAKAPTPSVPSSDLAPVEIGELTPQVGWSLVGLNLVAAAFGAYSVLKA